MAGSRWKSSHRMAAQRRATILQNGNPITRVARMAAFNRRPMRNGVASSQIPMSCSSAPPRAVETTTSVATTADYPDAPATVYKTCRQDYLHGILYRSDFTTGLVSRRKRTLWRPSRAPVFQHGKQPAKEHAHHGVRILQLRFSSQRSQSSQLINC